MKLQDIFDQLQYGELSHLSLGALDTPERQKQAIAHINMGLLELHKRFWLISKNLIIYLYPHMREYLIDYRHLITNQIKPEPYQYILESVHAPFKDDLLKIESIFDNKGKELPLNNVTLTEANKEELSTEVSSFFTPQYNILRVPIDYVGDVVIVQYRANHPKLSLECEPEETEVILPPLFLEPLLLYVGHRASRILNSDTNQESNNYLQQFELSCKNIRDWGYEIKVHNTNIKLDNSGWV